MKKKYILYIVATLLILSTIIYLISNANKNLEQKIKKLETEISFLKTEQMPIRYKIISYKDEKIEVSVKFYDLDGKEVSKKHFEINGNVVSFDFYVVKLSDKYIAFPTKIFSDKIKPEDGINLFEYYEKSGFPLILSSKNANKTYNDGIKALFEKIKNNDIEDIKNIFGNMVQNAPQTIQTDIEGKVYKIIVHSKGGIEIIED